MASFLFRNVRVWDGENDEAYLGEIVVQGNRIKTVARGRNQISGEAAAETIDGQGMTIIPGMVEGHCHLSFVGIARNQDLGEIPVEEHLLRTCRNATFILDCGFTSAYSAASAKMRLDVVVRQEIADGYLAGPRYRAAGPESRSRVVSATSASCTCTPKVSGRLPTDRTKFAGSCEPASAKVSTTSRSMFRVTSSSAMPGPRSPR